MKKNIPNSLAALRAEKMRLKLEAQAVLMQAEPVKAASEIISDYDADVLFELASLIFYPKKTRNMKIMSLAIPVVLVSLNKTVEYLKDNEVFDDVLQKAQDFLKK